MAVDLAELERREAQETAAAIAASAAEAAAAAAADAASDSDGEPEVGEWETQGPVKRSKPGGGPGWSGPGGAGRMEATLLSADAYAGASVGLANRYGSNSCFLNVVVQSLARLRPFAGPFLAAHSGRIGKLSAARESLPGGPDGIERTSVGLVMALTNLLRDMAHAASAAPGGGTAGGASAGSPIKASAADAMRPVISHGPPPSGAGAGGLSLGPFKTALHRALIAREVARANAKRAAPGGASASVTPSAALSSAVAAMASRAMGDASEALEEIVTLLHEAEAVTAALLATGRADAALGAPLPPGSGSLFTTALDLPHGPGAAAASSASSVALRAFGVLHTDTPRCPAPACGLPASSGGSCGQPVTSLGTHVSTWELLEELGRAHVTSGGARVPFDRLLRAVVRSRADPRSCATCGSGPLTLDRDLLAMPAGLVTVVLGWTSPHEPAERLGPLLGAIDGVIDLRELYSSFGGAKPPGPVPARLRGMVCYLDNHWVALFETGGGGGGATAKGRPAPRPQWVCANDERVFPCDAPLSLCAAHRLQPSLLFYEAGHVGDPIPADRGRSVLHSSSAGDGEGGSQLTLPLEIAAAGGAAALALSSQDAFPSLGGGAGAPARAPPPKPAQPPPAPAPSQQPVPAPATGGASGGDAKAAAGAAPRPQPQPQPLAPPAVPQAGHGQGGAGGAAARGGTAGGAPVLGGGQQPYASPRRDAGGLQQGQPPLPPHGQSSRGGHGAPPSGVAGRPRSGQAPNTPPPGSLAQPQSPAGPGAPYRGPGGGPQNSLSPARK